MSLLIAIDGPAAAGKGSISRAIAKHFGISERLLRQKTSENFLKLFKKANT